MSDPVYILPDWLGNFLPNAHLPTPAEQASNIIRFIGDHVSSGGQPLEQLPVHFYASIGAPGTHMAAELLEELEHRGLLTSKPLKSVAGNIDFFKSNLTLDGWERYEAEKRGKFAGNYGFIAMEFNDPILDPFVRDVLKPCIKTELAFDLVDMREVACAGIIDNIMRAQIRDAAFVIVDLTHDNPGAYWEAGYAEGLGKPVIYICEKRKFVKKKTHFDTNHCTTVVWSKEEEENFKKNLVATLRRSLNLF